MHIVSRLTPKLLGDVQPGELLLLRRPCEPADLGFVMDRDDDQLRMAILYSGNTAHAGPFWTSLPPNDTCASFGFDWIFEVGEPKVGVPPPDNQELDTKGTCILSTRNVHLRLAPNPFDACSLGTSINLATRQTVTKAGGLGSIGVRRWRIWASKQDMTDPRKHPIYSFGFDEVTPKSAVG